MKPQNYFIIGLGLFFIALADSLNVHPGSIKDLHIWGQAASIGFLLCFLLSIPFINRLIHKR